MNHVSCQGTLHWNHQNYDWKRTSGTNISSGSKPETLPVKPGWIVNFETPSQKKVFRFMHLTHLVIEGSKDKVSTTLETNN